MSKGEASEPAHSRTSTNEVFSRPLGGSPQVPDHELLRVIGRGAYGEVWLARSMLGEYRAVKVVYRRSFEDARPFEREFAGIKKFEPISRSHDSQVDILHVGQNVAGGYFYYVMDLADNANEKITACEAPQSSTALSAQHAETYTPKTLKKELHGQERLPMPACLNLGLSLTTALDHLHKNGLVHRDIKPSNIIFVSGQPKLADIGLVAAADATGSRVGTPGFTAPEGPGTVTADLYSLGKVLYEAATGRDRQEFPELPTRLGRSEREEAELIEINQVILKACATDPSQRYQSAMAMRTDLELLKSGHSLVDGRNTKRRFILLAKTGMVVTTLALVVAILVRHYSADHQRAALAQAPTNPATEAGSGIPDAALQFESFEAAIRSKANQYARLTPGTLVGKSTFAPFRLNVQPLRWGNEFFDAVRFTTPPEKGLDMAWAFTFYNRKLAWMLLPIEGNMERGFQRYWHWPATRYENVPAPAPDGQNLARSTPAEAQMIASVGATNETMRRIFKVTAPGIQVVKVQGMPGRFLEPNRDYLLVFHFFREKPAQFDIAMDFIPPGTAEETNVVSLEKALGLAARRGLMPEESDPDAARR